MTKVIMNGCNGKMGQCITAICKADSEIEISRSKTNAKMLLLSESENNFYTILREKFGWGVAPKK